MKCKPLQKISLICLGVSYLAHNRTESIWSLTIVDECHSILLDHRTILMTLEMINMLSKEIVHFRH